MKNNTMRVSLVVASLFFTSLVLCNGPKEGTSEPVAAGAPERLERLVQTEDSWAAAQKVAEYLNKLSGAEAERNLSVIVPLMIKQFTIKQLDDEPKVMLYLAGANTNAAKQWLIRHMTDMLDATRVRETASFYEQRPASYSPRFLGIMLASRNSHGRTFLMETLLHPGLRALILPRIPQMISQGADIDAQDKYGYTALMYAAEKGDLELADKLLANGANPYASGVHVSSPSAEAAALVYQGSRQISAITLARGNAAMEEIFAKHLRKPLAEIFEFHGGRKEKSY